MARVSYCIDKPHSNKSYIILRVNHKGQRIVVSTGISIAPNFWDKKKQLIKTTNQYPNHPEINQFLRQLYEDVERILIEVKILKDLITFQEIKERIKKLTGEIEIKESNFLKIYAEFINTNRQSKAELSIKKYQTFQNQLIQFQKSRKFEITFDKINTEFYDRLSDFYFTTLKINTNTFGKYITVLKTFMNWSLERGYTNNLEFKKFKAPKIDPDIVYLTNEEVMILQNLDLSNNNRLEKVRDVFCLECYTGLRYSDVKNLKKDSIKGNHLIIRTEKTHELLNIPLRNEAVQILKKYFSDSNKLPVVSNQKMNAYLKELCKLADISENITVKKLVGAKKEEISKPKYEFISTHTSRRTFVTLSLEMGLRPEIVMAITGHKDFKTMKKYLKLTSKVVQTEFERAWNNNKDPKLKIA